MAWRIEGAVDHGEIDNTVEGRTTGRVWLVGRDEPLFLSLDGDCWRDLAGTRLVFENPTPVRSADALELDVDQSGVIGDMTASRRARVPLVGGVELQTLQRTGRQIPTVWKNILYLEWFSEINGRVVIETSGFSLSISAHEWQMDEDAEEAQKLANLNSMRDFMAQVIQRRDPEGPEQETSGELDEFAWEERLKESDRLTDAYQEVLEKYMEDADCEQKEAFVMGWDGLLDALAERDEAGEDVRGNYGGYDEDEDEDEDGDDEDEDGDEDDLFGDEDDEGGDEHPLQIRAQALARRAMDAVGREGEPGTPAFRLVNSLLQVSGKLAGALNGRGSGYEPETGFVLAVLKRCLNWLNEAVGACSELSAEEPDEDHKAALEDLQGAAFEIRDGIVALRRELKQS
jgi:hypothetical protein